MGNHDKLELLYDIETQFEFTGQNTIPVNDIEAYWMKNKKGNQEISYNIQSAVDYDTKLICAVNVTQNPTDHYQLPKISNKAIENIKTKPKNISADTSYLNQISLTYLANNEINGLIPTRKQSKEKKTGRLNKNPFHKDHFEYINEKDTIKCQNNEYMYFYKQYIEKTEDNKYPNKIKRLYSNYTACKNCKFQKECTSPKTTHRTITEYDDTLKQSMYQKMETEEAKEEYKKRSNVKKNHSEH